MNRRQLVGYCGLYCGLCDQCARIPERAAALLESLHRADFEGWGPGLPGFKDFWNLLNGLAEVEDDKCCRTWKCGAPVCAVRKCAIERHVEICPDCADYPCERLKAFAKGEPLLLADGQRIREIGLDA